VPPPLAEFVTTLSAAADAESAVRDGIAHAVRVFGAEVAAWVREQEVVVRAGAGAERLSDACIISALGGSGVVELPGRAAITTLAVSSAAAGDARLVVGRRRPSLFTRRERGLLDDMARVLTLTSRVSRRDPPGAGRALRNSEHRLRGILQSAHDAFIALDTDGLVLDWNVEAEVTFGWPRADALGRKLAELIVTPEARPALKLKLEAMSRDDSHNDLHRTRLEAVHRNGRCVPLELRMSRLKAGDTHILQVFARDRTEPAQAERDRRAAEDQLAIQALHDPLTGLPNRALLFDRLGHALVVAARRGSLVAVLFVDVDNFRLVNENLGHQIGDELLIEFARRLARNARASDTMGRMDGMVGRFGGDEFVLVCEDIIRERDAITLAERITSTLKEPFARAGQQLLTTASIGIGFGRGAKATPDSVIREAEAAMYRAKEQGRARYELFDPTMGDHVFNRLRDETELRQAIEDEQLRVFYQPIVSVMDEELIGVEALVRWQHPERGLLAPLEFLPLAEDTGMIVPLGRWVLGEACAQASRWQLDRRSTSPLRVAVNLSARQLTSNDLVHVVADRLARAKFDPSLLTLEITESVLMERSEDPVQVLRDLRTLGVRIALDDFGTGYSSLSYLQRLPLDIVKLDRSFISGLPGNQADRQILGAIAQMTQALSLTLIAEGVETEQQLSCLRDLGCQLAQGYYFAAPLPAAQVTEILKNAHAPRRGRDSSS
jgi:diguanylate cyclase (GGDEF)-like protein/PAS domain S-box-containing protein